jgi:NADPH:quinone reductase-like Zn-dependent oxidoreductase
LGEDVAGEVIEVGSSVKRFRVGDWVVSHACLFFAVEAFNPLYYPASSSPMVAQPTREPSNDK